MKKTIQLLCAALTVAALLPSCSKEEDKKDTEAELPASFMGSTLVTYENEDYTTEGITVGLSKADEGHLDILMHKVKFVPQMPVTIDITLPAVSFTSSGGIISFSASEVIPLMGGDIAVEKYRATGLSGRYDTAAGTLSFSTTFGTYPTVYTGTRAD